MSCLKMFLRLKFCLFVNSSSRIHSSSLLYQTTPQSTLNVFDRQAKKYQKERAAIADNKEVYDYLKDEVGDRLADRIFDIQRTFKRALDLGCGGGYISKRVESGNVEELVSCDVSERVVSRATCEDPNVKHMRIVCDEENLLDVIEPDSLDLVISNLTLHWVNNLPSCFEQIMKCLKNDGVFMATVFGGDTLYELRSSLQLAEQERLGGIAAHVSPFARVRDIGGLLTRAGFVMQTIDTDEIVVNYPSMLDVMQDIKGMGEGNSAWNRKLNLSRDVITAASAIYQQLYGKDEEDRVSIPATFQIIYLLGWKPDPSQPKPIDRGTGEVSFKDLYRLEEVVHNRNKLKTEDTQDS